jgi:hypothetical protein
MLAEVIGCQCFILWQVVVTGYVFCTLLVNRLAGKQFFKKQRKLLRKDWRLIILLCSSAMAEEKTDQAKPG